MINIFLFRDKKDIRHLRFLDSYLGITDTKKLFEDNKIKNTFFNFASIEEADFVLLPHNYFDIKNHKDYLEELEDFSRTCDKQIIVFAYGDSDEVVPIQNAIILRTSQYKYKLKENEIIIPPLVENLGQNIDFIARNKGFLPIVGFAGWAGFPSFKQRLKYLLKNLYNDIKSSLGLLDGSHKQGLYFRIKSIKKLNKSPLIKTNFILRNSYSAHQDTIGVAPDIARKQYVKNILESDLILSPKGDGNYSARFFEVLSLGRIPLLIDTETVLPMEKVINYDDFVLRVDYRDINKLDRKVSDFYKRITNDEFIAMQKRAWDTYNRYLSPQKSLEHIAIKLQEYVK
jgi:hypothetical protein